MIRLVMEFIKKQNNMNQFWKIIYVLFCIATAVVGNEIHHNAFYAICNFLFAPLSWLVWLISHDVNMTIIKDAFSFFLQ